MDGLNMLGAVELAPSLADVLAGHGVIKSGSKGESVKYVQELVGFEDADGDFGPRTEAAVKAFQRAQGLTADGIVGKGTMAALDKIAHGELTRVNYASASPGSPATAATQPVRRGAAADPERLAPAPPEPDRKSNVGTYAALGLGGLALGGLAYAVTR